MEQKEGFVYISGLLELTASIQIVFKEKLNNLYHNTISLVSKYLLHKTLES